MSAGMWIAFTLAAVLAVVVLCLLVANIWYEELWGGWDE